MKYVITDIAPADAFYSDKDELIGEVMELEIVKEWTEDDEVVTESGVVYGPRGYCWAKGDYHFHAVKLRPATRADLSA